MEKNLFNRRRAIECKIVRESKSHPGYYRYDILIGERDGSTHWEPAYGVDMSDALERLLWKERIDTLEDNVSKIPSSVILLLVLTTIIPGAIVSSMIGKPSPIMISIGINILIMGIWKTIDYFKNNRLK